MSEKKRCYTVAGEKILINIVYEFAALRVPVLEVHHITRKIFKILEKGGNFSVNMINEEISDFNIKINDEILNLFLSFIRTEYGYQTSEYYVH